MVKNNRQIAYTIMIENKGSNVALVGTGINEICG
jgi:hypothetical protein